MNKYTSRKFLNKDKGMAAMQSIFEQSFDYVDCSIAITDCNRQVTLDFSASNKRIAKEKLAKLNLIIEELTKVKRIYENIDYTLLSR